MRENVKCTSEEFLVEIGTGQVFNEIVDCFGLSATGRVHQSRPPAPQDLIDSHSVGSELLQLVDVSFHGCEPEVVQIDCVPIGRLSRGKEKCSPRLSGVNQMMELLF